MTCQCGGRMRVRKVKKFLTSFYIVRRWRCEKCGKKFRGIEIFKEEIGSALKIVEAKKAG